MLETVIRTGDSAAELLDCLRERYSLTADRQLPGFDAHVLEQIVDEPCESKHASLDRQHQLRDLLFGHRA